MRVPSLSLLLMQAGAVFHLVSRRALDRGTTIARDGSVDGGREVRREERKERVWRFHLGASTVACLPVYPSMCGFCLCLLAEMAVYTQLAWRVGPGEVI